MEGVDPQNYHGDFRIIYKIAGGLTSSWCARSDHLERARNRT
jgi:hypothetical protein